MAESKEKMETNPSYKTAIECLKKVEDPELNLDVWTLGLIYGIDIKDKNITITMTFTSPTCPYAPQLMAQIKYVLEDKGYKEPKIEITFEPVWEPSEEVKELLGLA
tara:strand:- start:6826 stop:7143 length:318 start_codon:yes stop_codon:yes gene_type:complete